MIEPTRKGVEPTTLLQDTTLLQEILECGGFWRSVTQDDGTLGLIWDDSIGEVLEEHGWIRLPVDADGAVIHVRDVMDGYNKTIEVVELRYGRSGWVLISRDGNAYADTFAFTHHHAPTVEDVLRDVVTLCHNTWKEESPFHFYDVDDVMKSGNIAEFAAKLQLREVDE